MEYRYFICDVFTETRFCGNQLAVLPEASGLSDRQMQQIAREFNFAETTFVFPPEGEATRKVRIFTPAREIPFAGHPNIGTAFVLATKGLLGEFESSTEVAFEEAAGIVNVSVDRHAANALWCELEAPQPLSVEAQVPAGRVAAALGLEAESIVVSNHPPTIASVGLPFLVAEVSDRDALQRACIDVTRLRELQAEGVCAQIHIYCRSRDQFDIRARMFAPLSGVPEDPATGSANCVLAGLLTDLRGEQEGDFSWRIAQGVELGRPSVLDARTQKRKGAAARIWIGGSSVLVGEGLMGVD